MIIQYASDLHLEFPENKDFIKANPLQPKGDVLLLGGDIIPFGSIDRHKDFFNYVSDNFKMVYWIAGNHEYYGFDAAKKNGSFTEKIRDNVLLVNNVAIQHENVRFVFSTLWSKIRDYNQWQVERGMNDFRRIRYNEHRFNTDIYNQFHEDSMVFLQKELTSSNKLKTVVLTHHVPTLINYPAHFLGTPLNDAFAVELKDFIEIMEPDFWLYGHHHQNIPAFTIGKTKMLTNQLGYVGYGEHSEFDGSKVFKI